MKGVIPLVVAVDLEADVLVFPIMISPHLCSVSWNAVERDKKKQGGEVGREGLPHFSIRLLSLLCRLVP